MQVLIAAKSEEQAAASIKSAQKAGLDYVLGHGDDERAIWQDLARSSKAKTLIFLKAPDLLHKDFSRFLDPKSDLIFTSHAHFENKEIKGTANPCMPGFYARMKRFRYLELSLRGMAIDKALLEAAGFKLDLFSLILRSKSPMQQAWALYLTPHPFSYLNDDFGDLTDLSTLKEGSLKSYKSFLLRDYLLYQRAFAKRNKGFLSKKLLDLRRGLLKIKYKSFKG